ncbi:hypothetical protein LRS03_01130 [Rhizobacter sp. J219]|uniref:hypothetical protein n=1 Tax=Rhizobacter sp. J219 TaxID=2898430 RepID=UPI002150A551|nr:hypothetical protein [Rhizobacter sp. J219]MCR5881544.1 hypothetical protein [Rhizobacter sp. J219]
MKDDFVPQLQTLFYVQAIHHGSGAGRSHAGVADAADRTAAANSAREQHSLEAIV